MKAYVYRRWQLLLCLLALAIVGLAGGRPAYCTQSGYVYDGVNRVDLSATLTNANFHVSCPFTITGTCVDTVTCNQSGDSCTESGDLGIDYNGEVAGQTPWSLTVNAGFQQSQTWYPSFTVTSSPTGARTGAAWINTTAGNGLTEEESGIFYVSS